MGFYETTYILHSALQEGRLNDIVNAIDKKSTSIGAEILYSDNWGRKKLSYLIQKEKYGTYIFFQYKMKDSKNLKELTSEFQHNPNVLRHLTIEIDEQDIMEKNEEKVDVNTKEKETETKKENKNESEKKSAKKVEENSEDSQVEEKADKDVKEVEETQEDDTKAEESEDLKNDDSEKEN